MSYQSSGIFCLCVCLNKKNKTKKKVVAQKCHPEDNYIVVFWIQPMLKYRHWPFPLSLEYEHISHHVASLIFKLLRVKITLLFCETPCACGNNELIRMEQEVV